MSFINKHLFLALSLLTCASNAMATESKEAKRERRFEISKHPGWFSTEFYLDEKFGPDSLISKSMRHPLNPWQTYQIYDGEGELIATASKRILSTGTFMTRMTEIDIYYPSGERLGMIDGQWVTTAQAKFSIYQYSAEGVSERVGIAYLDVDRMKYTIYHPENMQRIIANFKRQAVINERDFWQVQIIDESQIDERIIRAFAAFAVDTQDYFKADDIDQP